MPDTQHGRWHGTDNLAALQQAVLLRVLEAGSDAVRARGRFDIVLAGGGTPRGVYEQLRTAGADWAHWHVWFGDERCLPPDHPERNSRMAREAWLDHVSIPPAQVHDMPAEQGPEAAARHYGEALASAGVGDFDLVLLGLGEDGHTASLFPGQDWGTASDAPAALPVFGAPKPPPERVSLSAWRLGRSRAVLFLVAGEGKREALGRWRAGEDIPARAVQPPGGVDVFTESALLA